MDHKVHFKGLNGIRAIASLIVVFFHIDQYMPLFGLPGLGFHKTGMAGYGVIMFFVLSGYLITYLMLREKQKYVKVDLLKFYMRRILRIWPLYYLTIALTIFLILVNVISIPSHFTSTLALYSLLLSNFGYALGLGTINMFPLWSVGVEEQFYLIWPVLINKSGNVFKSLFGVAAIYFIIKVIFRLIDNGKWYNLICWSAIDSMAIGGIGAVLVFQKSKLIKKIHHISVQVIAWLFLIVSVYHAPVHVATIIDNEIHSLFYLILIINVSTNPKSIVSLENKVLNYLGKISYGIYMYHITIVILLSYFLPKALFSHATDPLSYFLIYLLIVGSTIFAAGLSYKFLESRILFMKKRYTRIESST